MFNFLNIGDYLKKILGNHLLDLKNTRHQIANKQPFNQIQSLNTHQPHKQLLNIQLKHHKTTKRHNKFLNLQQLTRLYFLFKYFKILIYLRKNDGDLFEFLGILEELFSFALFMDYLAEIF